MKYNFCIRKLKNKRRNGWYSLFYKFLSCSDVRRQHEKNIEKLRDLVNALQDLAVLKKSYNLVFTLDNYIKDSLDETAFCILQRVQITNLKSLVNDFLYPIYMERGRSPVKAIRKYITFLVASRQNLSSWLNRAVTSIELLHSEDARLESALLVLQVFRSQYKVFPVFPD